LIHAFYIMGNNTLAFLVGSRTPPWAIVAFTLITLVVVGIFVRAAVRAPYFNPKIRWWENKPRFAITLQVELANDRTHIVGETYNISEGGMYMVGDPEISIGENFKIKLSRNGTETVQCEGRVVWVNPAGEKLPQGFGITFTEIDRPGLKEIKSYIVDQKRVLKEKAEYR